MNNCSENCLDILSDIIQAKYRMQNKSLFDKEYAGMCAEGHIITNIVYLQGENIALKAVAKDNAVTVHYKFDLVFVYELLNCNSGIKSYNLITDTVENSFSVGEHMVNPYMDAPGDIRYHCKIGQIYYRYDIDPGYINVRICINSDIYVFLLKEAEIRLFNSERQRSLGWNPFLTNTIGRGIFEEADGGRNMQLYNIKNECAVGVENGITDEKPGEKQLQCELIRMEKEIINLRAQIKEYIREIIYFKDANRNLYFQMKELELENTGLKMIIDQNGKTG